MNEMDVEKVFECSGYLKLVFVTQEIYIIFLENTNITNMKTHTSAHTHNKNFLSPLSFLSTYPPK